MENLEEDETYIYSNGFRGSPNGWSKLGNISFLVGENSSGKSSYMKLWRIIISPAFQLRFDCFLESNADFDMSDYKSKSQRTKNYGSVDEVFTIGFFGTKQVSPSEKEKIARLVSYKAGDSSLQVSRITELFPNEIRQITFERDRFSPQQFSYRNKRSNDSLMNALTRRHFTKIDGSELVSDDKVNRNTNIDNSVLGRALRVGSLWDRRHDDQSSEERDLVIPAIDYSRVPDFAADADYLGPIRAATARLVYTSNDSSDTSGKTSVPKLSKFSQAGRKALNTFGSESGLFDKINVTDASIDMGKGATKVTFSKGGRIFFADELGQGVTQILPIIVEILRKRTTSILMVEQPEVHLHPKAQAALGTLLYAYGRFGHRAVIETHSDYLINRFRHEFINDDAGGPRSRVLFFQTLKGVNSLHHIEIDRNGCLFNAPPNYRSFFLKEEMNMMDFL